MNFKPTLTVCILSRPGLKNVGFPLKILVVLDGSGLSANFFEGSIWNILDGRGLNSDGVTLVFFACDDPLLAFGCLMALD